MNLKTSRLILKINGILDLLFGFYRIGLGVIGSIAFFMFAGGRADETFISVIFSGGVVWTISGIIGTIEGVYSIKAATDDTKVEKVWMLSILAIGIDGTQALAGISEGLHPWQLRS